MEPFHRQPQRFKIILSVPLRSGYFFVAREGLDLPQALTGFQPTGDHTLPDYRWGESLSWNQRPQRFDEVMDALAPFRSAPTRQ